MAASKECTILFNHKNSLLSPSTVGLPMDFFQVVVSHDYDRKIMPEYEVKIDTYWQERLKINPSMYNGSKFRFNSLTEQENYIKLEFGLTCYKDFQCTNMQSKENVEMLKEYGLHNYGDVYACMANPTFSTVIVESSDNYAVLFRRSNMVGEAAGMVDFPGGHMEPNEVDEHELLENMSGNDVVKEFYYSALREVRDEVNLPESSLSWPSLLGILRNNEIGGKPGACFYIRCSLTSEEIDQLYQKGGPESYESTEVILIKMKDIYDENSSKFTELSKNMAVSALAAYQLFKLYYKERT